jgi:hypothetical protein
MEDCERAKGHSEHPPRLAALQSHSNLTAGAKVMARVAIANDIAEKIRSTEGPVELVDLNGETVGIVRRPPSGPEIERAKSRASNGGPRLSWAQVVAKVSDDRKP